MVAFVAAPKKESFVGFNVDSATHKRIRQRAAAQKKVVAAHVRDLVLSNLEGEDLKPLGYEPDILDRLALIYGGYFAPKLIRVLAESSAADQPKILHDLLAQFLESMACGASPEQTIVAPRWELRPEHPLYMPPPAPTLVAAESAAPYEDKRRSANSPK